MPSRMIRDSWLDSPTLDKVGAGAERLFVRLLMVADDFGRFCADPHTVQARCFPRRVGSMMTDEVNGWLQELVGAGAVELYRVGDRAYGFFPSWDRHQRRRNKHSKYPAPPSVGKADTLTQDAGTCEQLSAIRRESPPIAAIRARESRVESRESRGESVPEEPSANVDNQGPNLDPVSRARSAVSVPWTEQDRWRIGLLVVQARSTYPRWWVQLGKKLSEWIATQPPPDVVASALGRVIEAKAHDPCGYLATVIRAETPNWHEANAVQRHEDRKLASAGGMTAIGDVLNAAMVRAAGSRGAVAKVP